MSDASAPSDRESSAAAGARPPARLIGLNIALLLGLGAATLVARAGAQGTAPTAAPGDRDRMRGEYTMLSGRMQGSTTHAIYVLDAANQELLVLDWDRGANRASVLGYRSLADDARYLQRPR